MNNRLEYHVDLLKDDGATIYGSTALLAANNVEAIEKAKHWAASFAKRRRGRVATDQSQRHRYSNPSSGRILRVFSHRKIAQDSDQRSDRRVS